MLKDTEHFCFFIICHHLKQIKSLNINPPSCRKNENLNLLPTNCQHKKNFYKLVSCCRRS